MKKYIFVLFVLFANFIFAESPVGTWKTIDDKTKKAKSYVKIYEYNGKIYGEIKELINPDEPNPLCTKCKGQYHKKPIIGMTILWDLVKDDDEYKNGQIIDPQSGDVYRCKIWVEGNTLKVRGYLGPLYRTQTWYRQ